MSSKSSKLTSKLTHDQDIQILTTKQEASSLIQGLPHAFRTSDGHFVPDHIRHTPGGMPNHLGIQKTFLRTDVDSIAAELEEVNSFGDGAADEWRKGLKQRGKDAMADSSRWERWEGTLPLGKVPADVLKEHDIVSFPGFATQQRQRRQTASQHAPVSGALPPPPFHGKQALPLTFIFFTTPFPMSRWMHSTILLWPLLLQCASITHALEMSSKRHTATCERYLTGSHRCSPVASASARFHKHAAFVTAIQHTSQSAGFFSPTYVAQRTGGRGCSCRPSCRHRKALSGTRSAFAA